MNLQQKINELLEQGYFYTEISKMLGISYNRARGYKGLRNKNVKRMLLAMQCALCDKRAENVHHIDKDSHNNSLKNLLPLCRVCHYSVHGKNTVEYIDVDRIVQMRGEDRCVSDIIKETGASRKTIYRIFAKHNLV